LLSKKEDTLFLFGAGISNSISVIYEQDYCSLAIKIKKKIERKKDVIFSMPRNNYYTTTV